MSKESLFDTIADTVNAITGRTPVKKVASGGIALGAGQAGYGAARLLAGDPGGTLHVVFGGTTAACGIGVRVAGTIHGTLGKLRKGAQREIEALTPEQTERAAQDGKVSFWHGSDSKAAIDEVAGELAVDAGLDFGQMLSDEKHNSLSKGDKAQLKLLRQLARGKIQYV